MWIEVKRGGLPVSINLDHVVKVFPSEVKGRACIQTSENKTGTLIYDVPYKHVQRLIAPVSRALVNQEDDTREDTL